MFCSFGIQEALYRPNLTSSSEPGECVLLPGLCKSMETAHAIYACAFEEMQCRDGQAVTRLLPPSLGRGERGIFLSSWSGRGRMLPKHSTCKLCVLLPEPLKAFWRFGSLAWGSAIFHDFSSAGTNDCNCSHFSCFLLQAAFRAEGVCFSVVEWNVSNLERKNAAVGGTNVKYHYYLAFFIKSW